MKNRNQKLLAYFGHHKCASMWINSIIQTICIDSGFKYEVFYKNAKDFNYDLKKYILDNKIDFLLYTDARYKHVSTLDKYRGFHVFRDPRDIAVSAYYSHLNTHSTKIWPELQEHRKKLKSMSKEEGILEDMRFTEYVFTNLEEWDYDNPHILDVKMEDLTKYPYGTFIKIFNFLKILDKRRLTTKKKMLNFFSYTINKLHFKNNILMPWSIRSSTVEGAELLGVIYDFRFEKQTDNRTRGTEDFKSHYRKGVAGDWRNHFTEKHKRYFKERYSSLLKKLGYEKDNNW